MGSGLDGGVAGARRAEEGAAEETSEVVGRG